MGSEMCIRDRNGRVLPHVRYSSALNASYVGDIIMNQTLIVCGAGFMKRSSTRPSLSVCLSVPSFDRSHSVRRVCCGAPWARARDIDRQRRGGRQASSSSGATGRRSAANASSVTSTAGVGCRTRSRCDRLFTLINSQLHKIRRVPDE